MRERDGKQNYEPLFRIEFELFICILRNCIICLDAEIKQAKVTEQNSGKAVKTLHHVDRLSRKLKRRITRHAIAEAKALKKQSKEAIHVMVYVAELVSFFATNFYLQVG